MKTAKSITAALAFAFLMAGPFTTAQGQSAPDPHHPSNEGSAQPSAPATQAPAPDGQSGMMGMMPMAQMMNMMAQGCMAMSGAKMGAPGESGMSMVDHMDGRIAFLRAELKITEEQASAWSEVEKALRANAQLLTEANSASAAAASSQQTLEQRLEDQVRLLSARLEGTRAIKAALSQLSLSPEQQKTADELIGAQMGLRAATTMPMGMMQTNGAMP